MDIKAFGLSDIGQTRRENQDAYLIDERHQTYAVADGLGGLPGGAETSRRTMELVQENLSFLSETERQVDLAEFITGINQVIAREVSAAYPSTGSGTTLTLCRITGNRLQIGHVGDSAAYLLRNGELKKLTIDHTMEQELIRTYGEEARQHMPPEYPHTLTRCIGQAPDLRVDQTRISLRPADRILLCTDGLNKTVSEAKIRQILDSDPDPEQISTRLTDLANTNSGPDNITVITLILS